MNTVLITADQLKQLRLNGLASIRGVGIDPYPVVKLFTPDGAATWLLTEIDPADEDVAFGLCDLGMGSPELGYVSLTELSEARGRLGPAVARDRHFTADKPLSAYVEAAYRAGRIVV